MNQTLIAELEKLNDAYPFRVCEVETLDGRRIRLTQRFRKLWGADEKKDGDIRIENGAIAYRATRSSRTLFIFCRPGSGHSAGCTIIRSGSVSPPLPLCLVSHSASVWQLAP